ncbi:hypothetical protein [Empedobacter sp.]|uniref:hypothetical protein n=1 Tax=Empedobacter sp. TaxID=1927715 RepID=UPI0028AD294A|nr:hypothetical protein [Empedobacter sp.]
MKRVLAVLGIQAFVFHSNFLKNEKKHVRLNEEELQKIEDALEKQTSAEDAETLATLQANETATQEALSAAFELHGLKTVEGQTVAEAVEALSAKCTEYGESKNQHSFHKTDGKDKQEDEEVENSADYAHNQVFNEDKFKTLK